MGLMQGQARSLDWRVEDLGFMVAGESDFLALPAVTRKSVSRCSRPK